MMHYCILKNKKIKLYEKKDTKLYKIIVTTQPL